MTSQSPLDDSDEIVIKPRSRRPFEIGSSPSSPIASPPNELNLQIPNGDDSHDPPRSGSIINLTSSTLLGIFQNTGYSEDRDGLATPWGGESASPIESPTRRYDMSKTTLPDTVVMRGPNGPTKRRKSTATSTHRMPKKGTAGYLLPIIGRLLALFGTGILYGLLVTHLHDRDGIVPVKVDGLDRASWLYLTFWGVAGVLLGEALPWADKIWADEDDDGIALDNSDDRQRGGAAAWNDVVRMIGAFVGIAFAIRKLPWQSTLQMSLTLALANPAIWFVIDRSPPGFVMSTMVAFTGTALLLTLNPDLIPVPSPEQSIHDHIARSLIDNTTVNVQGPEELVLGIFTQQSVGVVTWVMSVLFISTICFGNIGRRLTSKST